MHTDTQTLDAQATQLKQLSHDQLSLEKNTKRQHCVNPCFKTHKIKQRYPARKQNAMYALQALYSQHQLILKI